MAKNEKREHPLQTLLGTAMLDAQFREQLLHRDRQALLPKFKLTDEEHRFLLSIKASTLQEFATAVDQWLEAKEN